MTQREEGNNRPEGGIPVQQAAGEPARRSMARHADPFMELRNQIDRVLEGFFAPFSSTLLGRPGPLVGAELPPPVDISETDEAIVLTVDLPGMSEQDIDISISNSILTLRGERRQEQEERARNYYLSERRHGTFSRALRLPETIDQDKCTARFDKGVLTITLPKTEQARQTVKKIEINKG